MTMRLSVIILGLMVQLSLANGTIAPGQLQVENGGLLFTDNPAGVSGTDGGYSIPMGDKTLWMFGDVFLLQAGPDSRYVSAVSNCGLLVSRGKGAHILRSYRFLHEPQHGLAR